MKSEATAEPEKSDGKEAREPGKSLINEKGEEEGAPSEYSEFKVPQGFELDKDVAGEATALFKKSGLTQTQAQELVDFYIKHTQASHNAPIEAWKATQDQWRSEINSDPEIGGSKLNGVKASLGKLYDSLGDTTLTDAFREAMDFTGAGNNPAVIRLLYRVAQRLNEGGPVRGGGPSPDGQIRPGAGAPSAAQAIYPNLPSIYDRR